MSKLFRSYLVFGAFLALLVSGALHLHAQEGEREREGETPPNNLYGWSSLVFQTPEPGMIRVVASGISSLQKPSPVGWDTVLLTHYYYPLSIPQVTGLRDGLAAWQATPHSDLIYSTSGKQGHSLSVTGTAWDPAGPRVVRFKLALWTLYEGPHHHGELHAVLYEEEVEELRQVLNGWLRRPYLSQAPLWQKTIY